MRIFPTALALAALCFVSCVSTGGAGSGKAKSLAPASDIPVLAYDDAKEGAIIASPVEGRFLRSEPDAGGLLKVLISCELNYYWEGAEAVCRYETIVGGLKTVAPGLDELKSGTELGTMSANPYLTSRCPSLDPFMIRMFSAPVSSEGYWYFAPEWFIPSRTQWLTFRGVESFPAAAQDFYRRWRDENEAAGDATIHYFPNLDRIEVPLRLSALPTRAQANGALALTEKYFYHREGLFTLENFIDLPGEYDAMLYWQDGFDDYLAKEYKLGSPLWVYCSIYALDHANKRVIVCARDFSRESNEETVRKLQAKAGK
jgi:hypothetical protein